MPFFLKKNYITINLIHFFTSDFDLCVNKLFQTIEYWELARYDDSMSSMIPLENMYLFFANNVGELVKTLTSCSRSDISNWG